MGNVNAAAMAEAVGEGLVGLRPALSWHLTANHYPPRGMMLQACLDAIAAVVDEDPEREIELPENMVWKGQSTAPAEAIVEDFHLEYFVENEIYGNESEEDQS